MTAERRAHEIRMAALFGCVGLVGFTVDFLVLKLCLHWMQPAFARLISLFCAMNVTFTINGLFVFKGLTLKDAPRKWATYLATNGFGNFCNYWIFVTLVSLHSRIWSDHLVALMISSGTAYGINYLCTRFFVFHKSMEALGAEAPTMAEQPSLRRITPANPQGRP